MLAAKGAKMLAAKGAKMLAAKGAKMLAAKGAKMLAAKGAKKPKSPAPRTRRREMPRARGSQNRFLAPEPNTLTYSRTRVIRQHQRTPPAHSIQPQRRIASRRIRAHHHRADVRDAVAELRARRLRIAQHDLGARRGAGVASTRR
jgi:hypothetical protein